MNKAPRILAVAAVTVLAVTGCSYSAADAAVVDGVSISETSVQASSEVVVAMSAPGATVGKVAPAVVQADIQGVVAQRIAAAKSITLNDTVRAPIFTQNPQLADLARNPATAELAVRLADFNVVATQLGADVFAEECAMVPVEMNPRYGTWTPQLCQASADLGGLARTAPTPAAKG